MNIHREEALVANHLLISKAAAAAATAAIDASIDEKQCTLSDWERLHFRDLELSRGRKLQVTYMLVLW